MSRVIGIDLGTTNSVVAVLENGRPEVIPNAEGAKTTPSIVHYGAAGEVIVGELAKRQLVISPERTIRSVKRFMGSRWEEAKARLESIRYKVVPGGDEMAEVEVCGARLRPEEVSAETLRKMKETAEAFLGEEITQAVITVPAHFNDSQRQATKLAAEKAGLQTMRIINEPTAAALAYGLEKQEHCKVAVFDFGGGTFDISILELAGDVFEVKSTGGDTFLGGDNINELVFEWIMERAEAQTGLPLRADPKACQRILEEAEKVKCELSTLKKTVVSLPFIGADASGPKHVSIDIAREEFVALVQPIIERLRPPCERALEDAGVKREDLSKVVLVGGSTRIPAVRDLVAEIFGRAPDCSLNPDEVVAAGAAIQAGIMSGDLAELLLIDVTPLSLGVELEGDVYSVLIPRNSSVPTKVTKKYTTVVDNQSVVNIHVLQGERKQAVHNRSLAHLRLTGIPPAPREIPEIEVAFTIDANGILTVGAMDMTSGVHKQIQVESFIPASDDDTENVLRSANDAAQEDKLFLQKVAARRRLREMEIVLERERNRPDGFEISETHERTIRETFFKFDVALSGESWEAMEEAERNARAIYLEVTSLIALQNGTSKGDSPEIMRIDDDPRSGLTAA